VGAKECLRCGRVKPFSEFYAHKQGRYGLSPRCKVCERARMRVVMRRRNGIKKPMSVPEVLEFIGKPDLVYEWRARGLF
jgi:hypothetical protein